MKKLVILLLTAAASFVGAANLTLQDANVISTGSHSIGSGCPVVAYTNQGQDILVAWQDANGYICGSWLMSGTWTTPTTILSDVIPSVYPISMAGNNSGIVLTYVDSESNPMSIFYNATSEMWTTPKLIISNWMHGSDSVATPVLVSADSNGFYAAFAYQPPAGVGVIGYIASSTGSGSWSGAQLFAQGAYSPTSITYVAGPSLLGSPETILGAVWASSGIGYWANIDSKGNVIGTNSLSACNPSSGFSLGCSGLSLLYPLYGQNGSLKQFDSLKKTVAIIGSLGNISDFAPQVVSNNNLAVTCWIDNQGNVQEAVGAFGQSSFVWSSPTQVSTLFSEVGSRPLNYFGVTSAVYNNNCIFAWASQTGLIYVSQGFVSSGATSTGSTQGLTGATVLNNPSKTGFQGSR